MIPVGSKYEVILLPAFGEILLGVIDDLVCAKRARQVQIPRAADACHFSPVRFGKLQRKRADATRRAVDQYLLSRLNLSSVAKGLEGGDRRHRYGRRLLERHVGRFQRQLFLARARVFGKAPRYGPEHLIPWLKLLCAAAD